MRRTYLRLLSGFCLLASLLGASVATAQPLNDSFANAAPLDHGQPPLIVSLDGATRETEEPLSHPYRPTHEATVWFQWTAPTDGLAVVSFDGTPFWPLLNVFTGAELPNLQPQALTPWIFRDTADRPMWIDIDPPPPFAHFFRARAGVTYNLQIDALQRYIYNPGMTEGPLTNAAIQLTFVTPSANDAFANAEPLPSAATRITGILAGSTIEDGEPLPQQALPRTIWYTWTAPATGMYTFSPQAGSEFALLTIYRGAEPASLQSIRTNATLWRSDCGDQWRTKPVTHLPARAGEVYAFQFGTYEAPFVGSFQIDIDFTPAPPNDDFAQATALSGNGFWIDDSTAGATREANEPLHVANGGSSVWYKWRAPAQGYLLLSTNEPVIYGPPTVTNLPSIYDGGGGGGHVIDVLPDLGCYWSEVAPDVFSPAVAIYSGSSLHDLSLIAAGPEAGGDVSAGTEYHIAFDSERALPGLTKFSLAFNPPAPNDHFHNRIYITGGHVRVTSHTAGASAEAFEPAHASSPARRTIWWSWNAPANAPVQLRLLQAPDGSRVAVYRRHSHGGLSALTQISTPGGRFQAEKSVTYHIAVDTFAAVGRVELDIEMIEPKIFIGKNNVGQFRFRVRSPAGSTIAILHSLDLIEWTQIGTHQMTADISLLSISTDSAEPSGFFKIVTVPSE